MPFKLAEALKSHHNRSSSSSGSTAQSSGTSQESAPPSILRKPSDSADPTAIKHVDTTTSTWSSSSFSTSQGLSKRMSTLSSTGESGSGSRDSDGRPSQDITPNTSVSSFESHCSLPTSSPFLLLTLSSTSTLQFLLLPVAIRPHIIAAVQKAWPKGIEKSGEVSYDSEMSRKAKERGVDGGIWEIHTRGMCWAPGSGEKVASKRILINIMTTLAKHGWELMASFGASAKDSGKDSLVFTRCEPDPDPVFFAVAFRGADRIWIIDADAEVGEVLEDGLKNSWMNGVQDARVKEKFCREIKLKGHPWSSGSSSALIQARVIHLVILKYVTICRSHGGYDLAGTVAMGDKDEGEMACMFFRRRRLAGPSFDS